MHQKNTGSPQSISSHLESLEQRSLMSGTGPAAGTFVYIESNNPKAGQNAILAYKENTSTGALTALPNGHFLTGGTGYRNAGPALGPDDSDKEVIASPDGRYLFAVNQGSNAISVFTIRSDGTLKLVNNAPVSSGGVQPISLSFSNDHLYVVNRGNSAEGKPGTVAPNVTAFKVTESGRLYAIPKSTVTLPLNLSTAQVLTSADGRFAFVDNFATPSNLGVSLANTLQPYVINGDGTLKAVKNGEARLPKNPPLVLGLVEDPKHHVIYSGTAPFGGVASFHYDANGKATYIGTAKSPGKASCWLTISPNGKFLYATDSGSGQLSVYSLADPYKPKFIQEFTVKGPAVRPGDTTSTGPTSQDFQLSTDPTGKYLWVVSHTTDDKFQQGNQLHTLHIGSDGMLSEPKGPQFFSESLVPATAHVFGLAVVSPDGFYDGYASKFKAGASPATSVFARNKTIDLLDDSTAA